MKVTLVACNGSYAHTCLAVRCLREPLERAGFTVTLSEHNLRDRTGHILESLWREQADVYGFSCYIWNLTEMLALAESLHAVLPSARIVLGGPEVSFATDRFETLPFVDAIVCGEGERAMTELCLAFRDGLPFERVMKGEPAVLDNAGILYRDGDASGGILYYESSRGCPYACAYCLSSATKGVRMKPVGEVLEDLETFEKTAVSTRIVKFVDRTFNADVGRANALWRALLDERFTKSYHFEICATLLNEESFEIFSRFPKGKIQLEIGLQSTCEEALRASARHIDPARVIANARRIREMGNIHVHVDLIAGLPFEGYERFAKSFDEAYGAGDLLQLGFLKLLYGTPLREKMEEYGYACLPVPPYTVLKSNWISYGELQRLSHIAEVLERYLESGRFAHALWYLTPHMTSPFRFWEGLCEYLAAQDGRPLQRISQPDAFRYLSEYAAGAVEGIDAKTLRQMLAADFEQHEHKRPPAFLR